MGMAEAVAKDLESYPSQAQGSPLAVMAMTLARVLDGTTSARDVAAVAKDLRVTLAELREAFPARAEGDRLDDLSARRAKRRTGTTG